MWWGWSGVIRKSSNEQLHQLYRPHMSHKWRVEKYFACCCQRLTLLIWALWQCAFAPENPVLAHFSAAGCISLSLYWTNFQSSCPHQSHARAHTHTHKQGKSSVLTYQSFILISFCLNVRYKKKIVINSHQRFPGHSVTSSNPQKTWEELLCCECVYFLYSVGHIHTYHCSGSTAHTATTRPHKQKERMNHSSPYMKTMYTFVLMNLSWALKQSAVCSELMN